MKKTQPITRNQREINARAKKHTDIAKAWLAEHDHEARKKRRNREKLLQAQRIASDLIANSKHLLDDSQMSALKKAYSQLKNRSSWEKINPKIAERVFKVQFTVKKVLGSFNHKAS